MKMFEYKSLLIRMLSDIPQALEDYGRSGWEICGTVRVDDVYVRIYLKREV